MLRTGLPAWRQFLYADIPEVKRLVLCLDADVAARSVQFVELPGPLPIHVQRDLPAAHLDAELDPLGDSWTVVGGLANEGESGVPSGRGRP